MWLTQKRHLYKLCSRWRCLTSTAVKVFMFPQKICCWCCKLDLKCQRNRKQTGWGKRAQWHPTVQPLTHQALFLSIIFKRKFWFLLLWWGVKVFHRELRFTIYIYIYIYKCQFKHLNSGRRDFFAFSILFVSSFHVSWKRETCWSLPQLPGDVIYMSRELMKFEQQSKNIGQEALIELQSRIWCTLNHVSLVRTETKGK